MSDEPHRAALLALLSSIPQDVYDGPVPSGATRPYVAVHMSLAAIDQSSLASVSDVMQLRAWLHCVGDTPAAAALVASSVRTALLDQRPSVSGRSCGLIREEDALPPSLDETTGSPVMDAICVYSFTSWLG